MALAQDAAVQGRDPRIVSVVGESNVGKTVFLGFLLDMLSQRAGDFEAIPRGAYSIDLQQTVISHMARRAFPPKTPMEANMWYWTYYQVRRRGGSRTWVDLVMPDMAGESLVAEVASPQTFKVIHDLMAKSAGILLLADAALAAGGSTQPDFFALKSLSYLDALHGGRRDDRISTPIALVLCKADHCPDCFDDPAAFARTNLNRMWNLCESRFSNVRYFAASAVGSLGYAMSDDEQQAMTVPLHVALRGILEPFEWIIDEL
jgi:hypothetical protein